MVWYDSELYGTGRYNTIWNDKIRYDTKGYNFIHVMKFENIEIGY